VMVAQQLGVILTSKRRSSASYKEIPSPQNRHTTTNNKQTQVRAVRRAEATADQLFPDEGERKEYEKRVTVVDGMQEDIEGVEWYLFQAEQMTKGKLQLLNDQGRWEPFKKDGLRGWLLIVVRAHIARHAECPPVSSVCLCSSLPSGRGAESVCVCWCTTAADASADTTAAGVCHVH